MAPNPRQKPSQSPNDPVTERGLPRKGPWSKQEHTETELEDDGPATEASGASLSLEEKRDLYGEDEYPPEDEEYLSPEAAAEATGTGTAKRRGGTLIGKPPRPDRDDSPESTQAGPPVKLQIVSGPDEGEVKRFKGVRMVVGRVPGCHLVLTDQTVSRRHLELVYGAKGVLLRDLESGNGTQVNGERVTERLLKHGDEITLGGTTLRFLDERVAMEEAREEAERKTQEDQERIAAAAQAQAEAMAREQSGEDEEEQGDEDDSEGEDTGATDSREPTATMEPTGIRRLLPSRRGIGLGAAGIVIIGVLGLWAINRKPPPPPPDQKEEVARKKYAYARAAMDDERYEDAVRYLDEVERLSPGIDTENLLATSRAELAALKSLETAQGLIAQQRFEDARAELARCPDASEKRNQERARLQELLDAQQTQALEGAAQKALGADDFDTAERAISLLPPARQAAWRTRLEDKQRAVATEKATALAKEREAAKAKEAQEKQDLMESAFGSVSRKLNEGAYDRATLECDRVIELHGKDADVRARAQRIKKAIPVFAKEYAEGIRKAQTDSLQAAYRTLEVAMKHYQEIDLPGALDAELGSVLNAAAVEVGRAAWQRADYGTAAVAYRGILDRNPDDPTAKEAMDRLGSKAEELYRTAYAIRDRDPKTSIQQMRIILEVVPQNSILYQKAKQQLKLMSP